MKSILYDIDPGGDIELVLHSPNTKRVVPTLNLVKFCPALPVDRAPEEDPGSASRNSNSENQRPELSNVSSLFEDTSILSSLDDILVGPDEEPVEVRMRASSSHLILASPIFKEILGLNLGFATRSARSLRELPVYDWDAKALAIVLNVIHGRCRQVPRKISLELMASIAIVTEHYQCIEPLQLSAEMWYSMANKPPAELSKESLMWLSISHVFSWPILLYTMSQQILEHFEGFQCLEMFSLPPMKVISKIDFFRRKSIEKIFTSLDELQETLSLETGCPESNNASCSSLALGALVRGRRVISDLNPQNCRPYVKEGHSITSIINSLYDFPQPTGPHYEWNTKRGSALRGLPPTYYRSDNDSDNCTVLGRMQTVIEEIQKEMKDVGLEFYRL